MTSEEMMDVLCRFKVGQTVYTKISVDIFERAIAAKKKRRLADPQPLQIIERVAAQCHGGVQMSYTVRPHIVDGWEVSIAKEYLRVAEIELTDSYPEWPEEENSTAAA